MRRCLAILLIALAAIAACATPAPAHGYANGRVPSSQLAPVGQGGCVKLPRDAAASWNTMQLYVGARLVFNGCLSAYRDYAGQVKLRRQWCAVGRCGNAAVPGTSNHGNELGAGDNPPSVRRKLDQVGQIFGWCKYRERGANGRTCGPSDAAHESWHTRRTRGIWTRRPDPGPDPNVPLLVRGSGGPGQGGYVKRVQRHLHRHLKTGRCHTFPTDGNFGPTTQACVKRLQRGRRLSPDGRVGVRTWAALRR